MKVIYIKTTENCNLRCKHCFVPHISNKMTDETFNKVIEQLKNFKNEKITIIWHGGEPTLIGKEKFERFNKTLFENFDVSNIDNHIQTNLLTYDEEWDRIYKKYFNNFVGISYDFDIRFFDKTRPKEKVFWDNVQKLKDNETEFNMIVTITRKVIELGAVKFFNWILDNDIRNIHLERLTKSGYAINHWDEIGFTNKEYNDFMVNLFNLYTIYYNKNKNVREHLHISPFESIMSNVHKSKQFSCAGSCSSFFTFNPDGSVKCCTTTYRKLGTVNDDIKKLALKNFFDKEKCHQCEFKKVCKSGCSVMTEIFDESGECIGNYRLLKLRENYGKKYDIDIDLSIKDMFI